MIILTFERVVVSVHKVSFFYIETSVKLMSLNQVNNVANY